MPQPAVKLIWSVSSCNFCPRSDVRTCQIKPGKLLSKISSALDLHESMLDSCESICTCCLADIDMIIRAVAIRGAMKDYFIDMMQNFHKGYSSTTINSNYLNGHYQKKSINAPDDGQMNLSNYSTVIPQEIEPAPPPPTLVARPPFSKDSDISELLEISPSVPTTLAVTSVMTTPPASTPTKKTKERLTRYQCILCDKIAGSKSHCMEHLICHSPVRPFTCSQCMKTYKSRKACREHLIVMHGVEKIEENLQRLVLVDHEGLKQLDNVCTQYRKVHNPTTPKTSTLPSFSSSSMSSHFKMEPEDLKSEPDGGSAWLYKPTEASSRLPPPLLQCLPSSLPESILSPKRSVSSQDVIAVPPSKRTRKGTPHKLAHSVTTEEFEQTTPEVFELDIEDSNDEGDHLNDSDKVNFMKNVSREPSFSPSHSNQFDGTLNQPYFPSFQSYKTEPSFPLGNRNSQSPTGGSRKLLPPCQICGRSFPTKEKMADHMRSHSEIKQFSCLVCNRYFKYRRGVTNHLKEVHHLTDRTEISSKVASHEIGCIVPKSSRNKERKRYSHTAKLEKEDSTSISEKVIQDTLSSLVDIQNAAHNTSIPILSSDESLPDADNISSHVSDHSSHASPHPSPHASPHPSPHASPHPSPHASPHPSPQAFPRPAEPTLNRSTFSSEDENIFSNDNPTLLSILNSKSTLVIGAKSYEENINVSDGAENKTSPRITSVIADTLPVASEETSTE